MNNMNHIYLDLLLHLRHLLPLASSILYSLGYFAEAAFEELSHLEVVPGVVPGVGAGVVAGVA